MKKKINFKLTFSLVSLFMGFLLIVLGNKNKYCLSFGLIFLAGALLLYLFDKYKKINDAMMELDGLIDETDIQDFDKISELSEQKRVLKKQKSFTCSMCFVFAFLLILVAFVNLF